MTLRQTLRVVVLLVAFGSIAAPAQAYLDPGTGSMIISALIGIVAALALAFKMFWYRLVGWVRGTRRPSPPGAVESAPAPDE